VRAYASLVARPCATALAVVTVGALVVPAHLRPTRTVLALIVAFTVVNVLVQAVRTVAITTGRYPGYLISTVISQFLVLATMVGLLGGGVTNPSAWFLAYVLANAVPTAVCALAWARGGNAGAGVRPPVAAVAAPVATAGTSQRRSVRREGLALLPAAVANMGMLRFDRLILPALASTAALGLYATVSTMTELVSWPLQAYADSRLGSWRAAHKVGRLRISPLIAQAAIYALVVGPALGLATYLLIVPLFGERYAAARNLVLPLMLAASLYGVSRVTQALLIGRGRNLLASAAETCGFVTSMAGYLVLIPREGALGAAYGSLFGYGSCLAFALVALYASAPRRFWMRS
jgi:O-antigen/teichoic acid export membrane protein